MLAADIARTHQLDEVLSFDMGGTTAKICLIDHGQPQHSRAFEVDRSYRFKKGSGLPVRIPVVEMVEIGAGGGSIVTVDALRRIRVGPESAGSEPGPACYGRGGEHATVTDADVVLGKLSADTFAGGRLQLDTAQAHRVMQHAVGEPLDLDDLAAAFAATEIVEENMASAARAHASEWGKGVQGRCLIAFGGAAPLHAAQLARKLKIQEVLVPNGAGVGSAIGFLRSPISFEVVRSSYMRLDALDQRAVKDLFIGMRAEAAKVLSGAGVVAQDNGIVEHREAYMRYAGQGYEVAVELTSLDVLDEATLRRGFEVAYKNLYGRTIPGMSVEILSWTLSLTAPQDVRSEQFKTESDPDLLQSGTSFLFDGATQVSASVVPRQKLRPGEQVDGPRLILEAQTTTVVPEDARLEVLDDGTLRITLDETS